MKNQKIIFWNVDTQRDFMEKDGALYIKNAETIKPNLKKLTEFARENNIFVVNTADFHFPDDKELSDKPDFITTFPPHCMWDSKGHNFIEETAIKGNYSTLDYRQDQETDINVYDNNIVLTKNKFDVFKGNPHTNQLLDFINPDIVIVYGVATNVCVNCAVLGLKQRGLQVIVIKDAIKELPNLPVKEIYDVWTTRGVAFIDTKDFIYNYQLATKLKDKI